MFNWDEKKTIEDEMMSRTFRYTSFFSLFSDLENKLDFLVVFKMIFF